MTYLAMIYMIISESVYAILRMNCKKANISYNINNKIYILYVHVMD